MEFRMAAVTEELARQDHHPGPYEADLAVRRVTVYFESIGLGPQNAADAAGQIVREVQGQWGKGENELAAKAIDRAADRIDEWLDELAASCPTPTVDLRVQLQWHIRPVLQRHPEGFLRIHDLHHDFRRAVLAAAQPILPASAPTVMPSQSLGDLPHPWLRVAAYVGLIRYWFTGLMWRIRARS
jgi:hypothetical protein